MTDNQTKPELLLPWYVNGTLNDNERRQVEAWLESSEQAQEELQLLQQLSAELQEQVHSKQGSAGELGWRRLQKQLEPVVSEKKPVFWLRPALAAAVMLICVQSILLLYLWPAEQTDSDWQTLSAGHGQPAIQVMFQPQATEKQIRELLQTYHLQLIDGPSAAGLYRARIMSGQTVDYNEMVRLISGNKAVIRHVAVE